jgi:saccharopine dehydrogenase-like NADP-dependent oxidoreductase
LENVGPNIPEYRDNPKISIQKVDIYNKEDLVRSLEWVDACLKATTYYTNLAVMEGCLKAGVHYTDMGGLFCTTRK